MKEKNELDILIPVFNENETIVETLKNILSVVKCNKYVPGTDIIVKNENKIVIDKPNYVVILAWHLTKRIIKLLLKKGYRGDFIVPLPKLKIIKN